MNKKTLMYLFLGIISVIILLPQLIALSASFKTSTEMFAAPLRLIPDNPTLDPWIRLFTEQPVLKWTFNSILIALIGTAINVVICAMAGYAFARFKFKGRESLFKVVIMTLMLPLAVYIVPLYLIMDKLNILNTYWALAIPVSESIFGVFLLTQFFKNIPNQMEEAALIDGCNKFQTFIYIFLPIAKSSLFTLAIFSFVWKWNMFLWALIALNKTELYPLIIGLSLSVGQYEMDKNILMAGSILTVIPILIIYFVFQKYIIGSDATSGLK